MARNHPPRWINSNTRLGAYLPFRRRKRLPHRQAPKWAAALPFFSQECARLSRIGREENNVAHCCRVLKLLRHPTTTSNTQKSCEPEPPFSRLAAQTQVL